MSNLGNVASLQTILFEVNLDVGVEKLKIQVHPIGTDMQTSSALEGPIPHAHINKGREPYTCIRLDIPEYFLHGQYRKTFSEQGNGKLKKVLDTFMRERCSKDDGMTNWEYLCNEWNKGNPIQMVDVAKGQPDYKLLPQHSDYNG